MKNLFIGAFNEVSTSMSQDSSVAGSKIQIEVINTLNDLHGKNNVECVIFPELASWPKNKLFVKKKHFGNVTSLFTVNFPFIKRFIFCCQVLHIVSKHKPDCIVQYNTTFLMNLFMKIYGVWCEKKILILQDLNSATKFDKSVIMHPVSLLGYLGAKTITSSFDVFIPISKKLVVDLNLSEARTFIFQGGVTALSFKSELFSEKKEIAVFAGALEEYNGIDVLVSMWAELDENMELHIFGGGSLVGQIIQISNNSSNIKYHGFQSPEIVQQYVNQALFNFCLRYSKGINQDYFFPSKFFDLLMESGSLVCNKFNNIPEDLKTYISFVNDDLSNLDQVLKGNNKRLGQQQLKSRRDYLTENYMWKPFLRNVFEVIDGK